MEKSPNSLSVLYESLTRHGFYVAGAFELLSVDCDDDNQQLAGQIGLLIGNAGPSMWRVFSQSDEIHDGNPDSMNRWTRRVVDVVAEEYDLAALYPFGDVVWPFQQFAQRSIGIKSSPLGIVIHPEFGLWHAFRAVLVFGSENPLHDEVQKLIQVPQSLIHPCDTCIDKPCLSSCPVSAFSSDGLDIKSCYSHLDKGLEPDCVSLGCRARDACPVGRDYRYDDAQVQFHMKSYRG